jgi:poly(glycerol-phosphate) alpha-glucosyltransferase
VSEDFADKRNENSLYAPNSPRARLDRETGALKGAILGLIKSGRFDAARQVLGAYAKANPADPEIKHIGALIDEASSDEGLREKMALLDGVETVFILENAFSVRNGAVASVLRKVKLMEDKWGYKPLILVCSYDVELRRFLLGLRRDGLSDNQVRLNKGSRVLNVYDYFQKSYADNLGLKTVYHKDGKGVIDVYEGGKTVKKEHYTGIAGALCLTEEFKGGEKVRETVYDDWGYVSSVREGETVLFYDTGGRVCIKARTNEKDEPVKLTVYGEDGGIIKECGGNAGLAALCLERLTADGRFYMLVFESGLMSKAAGEINRANAAKAIVVHSVFLKDSYDLGSPPQLFYRYMCENRQQFDRIIFLTNAERDDFLAIYGDAGNTAVIPHPYPYPVVRADFDRRDHRKAVAVTRLDALKQNNIAVDIFKIAVEKLPDVKLEIYGHGEKEDELREQIKALNLENNVFLMGLTNDPIPLFSEAALYLTASAAEGFPLTLVESICGGCPVFAFDIKYGPSDIVEDGKTGYLISRWDKELYAARLISYFEDVELQRTMSENAYNSAERFGTAEFLERWYRMTEGLYRRE